MKSRHVRSISNTSVRLDDGTSLDADLILWATGAEAPRLLSKLGLSTDDRGFLWTRPTLQTLDSSNVFAVGDTGTIQSQQLPKSGVYAVRQGPVLWENLCRTMGQQSLAEYQPQKSFMRLINLGNGHAIGQWHGMSFSGRWAWRLKHRIDGRSWRCIGR